MAKRKIIEENILVKYVGPAHIYICGDPSQPTTFNKENGYVAEMSEKVYNKIKKRDLIKLTKEN
ncbi:MAG TPA: hypothetical protein PLE33_05805 [Candidatus Cloacimonas sp.]|nr:hypothetical protein [Candidatus Cloacimonas sp.]HPS60759.1 hypothetical protein [Candidatus Cloacimonas sp.]